MQSKWPLQNKTEIYWDLMATEMERQRRAALSSVGWGSMDGQVM